MRKYLFSAGEHIYKANLHCHTTVSDGAWTVEQTKEMYRSEGYSVVAFTDHNILVNHSYLNDESFLALNACEVDLVDTSGPWRTSKVYHFNLYSKDPGAHVTPPLMTMPYQDIDAINEYIAARRSEGYLVSYNHPYWSMQTHEDYAHLRGCFAMEIYNHAAEVSDGYYGFNPQVYDEMLRSGGRLFCLATDDNHSPENAFGGYVMINIRKHHALPRDRRFLFVTGS